MIVWSGYGWLGYVIIGGILWAMDASAGRTAERDPSIYFVSWLVTTIACWFVGRRLNRGLPVRVLGFHSRDAFGPGGTFDGHTTAGVRLEFAGLVLGGLLYLFCAFVLIFLPKPSI